jgi:C4-type Zn-finger protein
MILKVTEQYDGRLPVFNVVKEVTACDNCGYKKDEVIKSFDTYEEADVFCNALIADGKARDEFTTSCGEEMF